VSPSIIISLGKSAHLVAGIRSGRQLRSPIALVAPARSERADNEGIDPLAGQALDSARRGKEKSAKSVELSREHGEMVKREEIAASAESAEYPCGSADATRTLALSVERLLRESSQFRWSSLRYCTLGKNEELTAS